MDNSQSLSNNGNKVMGFKRNNGANQVWIIEFINNGNNIQFKNVQRNKCFDNTGKAAIGQFYHIWDCGNDNKNQWFEFKFPVQNNNDGWVNIVGPDGLCVSAKNNGGNLIQEKCGDSVDLLWSFLPYGKNQLIVSKNGRVMDNSQSLSSNGNK